MRRKPHDWNLSIKTLKFPGIFTDNGHHWMDLKTSHAPSTVQWNSNQVEMWHHENFPRFLKNLPNVELKNLRDFCSIFQDFGFNGQLPFFSPLTTVMAVSMAACPALNLNNTQSEWPSNDLCASTDMPSVQQQIWFASRLRCCRSRNTARRVWRLLPAATPRSPVSLDMREPGCYQVVVQNRFRLRRTLHRLPRHWQVIDNY